MNIMGVNIFNEILENPIEASELKDKSVSTRSLIKIILND